MKDVSSSGAQRNTIEEYRHDLVVREFIHSMAKVMAEGAESHGDDNWKKGFDNPMKDIWNHIWEHERRYFDGDKTEDHLAKMAVGCMFQWYFDKQETGDDTDGSCVRDGEGDYRRDGKDDEQSDSFAGESRHPSTTYGEKKGPSPKSAEELLGERYADRKISSGLGYD